MSFGDLTSLRTFHFTWSEKPWQQKGQEIPKGILLWEFALSITQVQAQTFKYFSWSVLGISILLLTINDTEGVPVTGSSAHPYFSNVRKGLFFSILPFSCLPRFSKECLFTACPVLLSDTGVWSWEWRWLMRERSQHEGPLGTWNQIILTLVLSCWMLNRKMYLLSLLMQWLLASLELRHLGLAFPPWIFLFHC